jgi:hypothetical protein
MIDSMVTGIMVRAIYRFAKETNTDPINNQILIGYNPTDEAPMYKRMALGMPNKEITFLEVLGKKFDMLGQEAITKNFITKTIHRYAENLGVMPQQIFFVISIDPETDDVIITLFKGNTKIEQITIEQLLGLG